MYPDADSSDEEQWQPYRWPDDPKRINATDPADTYQFLQLLETLNALEDEDDEEVQWRKIHLQQVREIPELVQLISNGKTLTPWDIMVSFNEWPKLPETGPPFNPDDPPDLENGDSSDEDNDDAVMLPAGEEDPPEEATGEDSQDEASQYDPEDQEPQQQHGRRRLCLLCRQKQDDLQIPAIVVMLKTMSKETAGAEKRIWQNCPMHQQHYSADLFAEKTEVEATASEGQERGEQEETPPVDLEDPDALWEEVPPAPAPRRVQFGATYGDGLLPTPTSLLPTPLKSAMKAPEERCRFCYRVIPPKATPTSVNNCLDCPEHRPKQHRKHRYPGAQCFICFNKKASRAAAQLDKAARNATKADIDRALDCHKNHFPFTDQMMAAAGAADPDKDCFHCLQEIAVIAHDAFDKARCAANDGPIYECPHHKITTAAAREEVQRRRLRDQTNSDWPYNSKQDDRAWDRQEVQEFEQHRERWTAAQEQQQREEQEQYQPSRKQLAEERFRRPEELMPTFNVVRMLWISIKFARYADELKAELSGMVAISTTCGLMHPLFDAINESEMTLRSELRSRLQFLGRPRRNASPKDAEQQ
jgi:hypothetical protein